MRVAYLLTQSTGGPVDLTVGLALALARRVDAPDVVIVGPEPVTSAGDATPLWRRAQASTKTDVRGMRSVRAALAAARPDLVHAQDRRAGLAATTVARLGVPVVTTYHGLPDGASRLFVQAGPWAERLEPGALAVLGGDAVVGRLADVTVAPSEAMARFLRDRLHLPARRVRHIANGIAPLPAHPVRDSAQRFVHVGTFSPQKDALGLVTAFAEVARTRPGITLTLAGDGPERAVAQERVRALGVEDQVDFLGYRTDIPAVLARADAFVLASLSENLPLALLEAMSAGLACVASTVGGVSEILRPGQGLLVPPGEPGALRAARARLADEPGLAPALGAAAAARVRDAFTLDRCADAHLRLYRDVLAR